MNSINWFCKPAMEALIRLHECTGWSGPMFPTYKIKAFFFIFGPTCTTKPSQENLKVPIITAADDILKYFYFHFLKKIVASNQYP